jgi:hypothetical protein
MQNNTSTSNKLSRYVIDWNDMREVTVLGKPITSILDENKDLFERRVRHCKYIVLDDGPTFPQTKLLYASVTYEVLFCTLTWSEREPFNRIADPDLMTVDDMDLDEWSWDDPDLPPNVIKSYKNLDHQGIGSDLNDWYNGISAVNINDFPKVLHPIITKSISAFKNA